MTVPEIFESISQLHADVMSKKVDLPEAKSKLLALQAAGKTKKLNIDALAIYASIAEDLYKLDGTVDEEDESSYIDSYEDEYSS